MLISPLTLVNLPGVCHLVQILASSLHQSVPRKSLPCISCALYFVISKVFPLSSLFITCFHVFPIGLSNEISGRGLPYFSREEEVLPSTTTRLWLCSGITIVCVVPTLYPSLSTLWEHFRTSRHVEIFHLFKCVELVY